MHFAHFPATFVVLARGARRKLITSLALDQVAYDPRRRRVVIGCRDRSILEQVERFSRDMRPAAVMVNGRGEVCDWLDEWRATTPGWIENSFLRAQQRPRCVAICRRASPE